MIALSKALSRATGINAVCYSAQLKTIVVFCGVALFVSLLVAIGLELSGFLSSLASLDISTYGLPLSE
jgi:hypothetical protein